MRNNLLLLLAFVLQGNAFLFSQSADFSAFPQENQLYQREMTSNQAVIPIKGSLYQQAQSIRVKVFRQNNLEINQDFPVPTGQLAFDFNISLPTVMDAYRIEAYVIQNGNESLLRTANQVLVGDAYLVMGQSNAVAGYGLISDNTYMRMFGWGNWQKAQPNIGMWQIKIAEEIIQKHQVPIAFINTAVSGSYMSENMPGTPIFQGTQTLVQNAGLTDHVRGFFWFQGESDASSGFTADYYLDSYKIFDAAVEQMIGQIDRKYIIQIRNGCWGLDESANPIREIQRQIPDLLDNYSIMTTQGLEHDGCHFGGYGYQTLGLNLARLMSSELYGLGNIDNVQAPNPSHAFLSAPNQIKIVTRDGRDNLEWLNAQSEFQLNQANGTYIIGGSADGSVITLNLSGHLPTGATLTYKGHGGGLNTQPIIRNSNSVGILAFHALAIQTNTPAENCFNGIDDNANGLTDGQDAACDCLTNPAIDCPDFDCSTIYIGVNGDRILIENN